MWRIALMGCLYGLALPVWADTPTRIVAVYDVFKSGLRVAEVEEQYVRQGENYQLSSTARPVGLIALVKPEKIFTRSTGRVGAQGLQPVSAEYEREKDPARSSHAEFNWAKKEVVLSQQTTRKVLDLLEGTQDRLSSTYQFVFLALRAKQAVSFPLVNGLSLSSQHYLVAVGDALDCGAGKPVASWYLDNQSKSGETHAEIWLRQYPPLLACKMRITDANGEQLEKQLRELVVEP